ncbi:MAG: JAB domain-containing protein [Bacteroidetes bacterium]|nr:MAG: JAB domain-containing protein [Bacteroidota bacterium]
MEKTLETTNSIKHWAEDDRPREKLQQHGAASLGLHELLGILINNGSKNASAIDLARQVLQLADNDLSKLPRLSVTDLQRIKGIGPAKAITIKAALELAVRIDQAGLAVRHKLTNSVDLARYLRKRIGSEDRELFVVVFLNAGNRILGHEVISSGGITGTVVDVRIVMRRAIESKATGLVLCHNHPSGNLKPSEADCRLTEQMKDAAKLLELRLIDHIIVSDEGYYSFSDEGTL